VGRSRWERDASNRLRLFDFADGRTPMSRSKEMGKPVEELTSDELRREYVRCRTLARVFPPKTKKLVLKRLLKIEERLENETSRDS
jgi:hypothetical protein